VPALLKNYNLLKLNFFIEIRSATGVTFRAKTGIYLPNSKKTGTVMPKKEGPPAHIPIRGPGGGCKEILALIFSWFPVLSMLPGGGSGG
jgi:hypothetical protein